MTSVQSYIPIISLSLQPLTFNARTGPRSSLNGPVSVFSTILDYLSAQTFALLSSTHRQWKTNHYRIVWTAFIQKDFPRISQEIFSKLEAYRETDKATALYYTIYRVLRTTDCYPLQTTLLDSHDVNSVKFNHTGRSIVTTSDRTACVYACQPNGSWVLVNTLKGPTYIASSAVFDPTNRYIVTTSYDYKTYVYEQQSDGQWTLLQALADHNNFVLNAIFDPKGRVLVTLSADETACIYEQQPNGKWTRTKTLNEGSRILNVAFDPSGGRLVALLVGGSRSVYTRNPEKGWEWTYTLFAHNKTVHYATSDQEGEHIIITPKGKHPIAASPLTRAHVYKRAPNKRWKCIAQLNSANDDVPDATFDSSYGIIDHQARIQKADEETWGQDILFIPDLNLAFDPTGRYIITLSPDNRVRIWGRNPAKIIQRAFERMERERARIYTSYNDLPLLVIRHKIVPFLIQQEAHAHVRVNQLSAMVYGHTFCKR